MRGSELGMQGAEKGGDVMFDYLSQFYNIMLVARLGLFHLFPNCF